MCHQFSFSEDPEPTPPDLEAGDQLYRDTSVGIQNTSDKLRSGKKTHFPADFAGEQRDFRTTKDSVRRLSGHPGRI